MSLNFVVSGHKTYPTKLSHTMSTAQTMAKVTMMAKFIAEFLIMQAEVIMVAEETIIWVKWMEEFSIKGFFSDCGDGVNNDNRSSNCNGGQWWDNSKDRDMVMVEMIMGESSIDGIFLTMGVMISMPMIFARALGGSKDRTATVEAKMITVEKTVQEMTISWTMVGEG